MCGDIEKADTALAGRRLAFALPRRVLIVNIRFLETFVWVAKLQSLRLTAEKLHATPAAISSRIASLENVLGEGLFERASGKIMLTRAGRMLLSYAERIVSLEEQMRERASNVDPGRNLLRIGVTEVVLHSWYPEFAKRMSVSDPRLEITVTSDTGPQLLQMLHGGVLDLVFHLGAPEVAPSASTDLGQFDLAWVASPALNLSGRSWTLGQLAAIPWVGGGKNTRLYTTLEYVLATELERMPRIHSVHSILGMIQLVVAGFGVSILPLAMIERELASGQLEKLLVTSVSAPPRVRVSPDADVRVSKPLQAGEQRAAAHASEFARYAGGIQPGSVSNSELDAWSVSAVSAAAPSGIALSSAAAPLTLPSLQAHATYRMQGDVRMTEIAAFARKVAREFFGGASDAA